MTLPAFQVIQRHRQVIGYLSSLKDFTTAPSLPVEPQYVLECPDVSLYCLDPLTKRAIFVELPPGIRLDDCPFVHQTQYEGAQRIIAVPFDTFARLGESLPAIVNPILIFMTGRCGSTLLSRALSQLGGVRSLSEPDAVTQFMYLSGDRGDLRPLLDLTVRFLFKPLPGEARSTFHVLKPRSQALEMIELLDAVYPDAKRLFLYRDAIGWANSCYRILRKEQAPDALPLPAFLFGLSQLFNRKVGHLAQYLEAGAQQITLAQQFALWWLALMESYLACTGGQRRFMALDYDALRAHPQQAVTRVLEYCGISRQGMRDALSRFDHDSQAGTLMARDVPGEGSRFVLSEPEVADIRAIVQRHREIGATDYIAPGTAQFA